MYLVRVRDGANPEWYALDPADKHRPACWRWGSRAGPEVRAWTGGWSAIASTADAAWSAIQVARLREAHGGES